jgi:hypothetical protein
MAWQMRRGRRAACCPPPQEDDAASVSRRQQELRASLDALAERPSSNSAPDAGYAVRK